MSFKYFLILSFCTFSSFISCTKKELNDKEYSIYLQDEDHGLIKSDSIDGVLYSISYRPTDLMVQQSLQNAQRDALVIDSLKKVYSGYQYFLLNISSEESDVLSYTDRQDFSRVLQDISFHMQDMVYALEDDKDTIYLMDFNTPRFYGVAKATTILLAFKQEKKTSEYFTIHLKGLFGGQLNFKFRNEDLTDVPRMKFDS